MEALVGLWEGEMAVGGDSLKLVMCVEQQDDTLRVVLDSPDQYVTDIPVDHCSYERDTLRFSVRSIGASYVGRYDGHGLKGRFTQYGRKFKLSLYPTTERRLFLRPQEPKPPYPYQEIELAFPYEVALPPISGTLTMPNGGNAKAVAILLSGSGRQDRDESICAHKPFKVLADHLTRAGYAVFRYDDPPYSTFVKQTTFDFARQARVVFDTLSARPEFTDLPVGFIGHSEGGMVAWIAAAETPAPDFVISLAGMGTTISEILLYQNNAIGEKSGLTSEQLVSNDKLNRSLYQIVEKSKSPESLGKKLDAFFKSYTSSMTNEQRKELHLTDIETAAIRAQLTSPWMFTLFHIRPDDYLRKVRCPVLALNGDRDIQVEASANLSAIEAGLKKCPSVTCQKMEGLNHLFQECETGTVEEYGAIEQTMSPQVLEFITQWLNSIIQ